LAPTQTVHSGI
jgi:uncharacterized glyoxalase superfamily protein PhnB